MRPLLGARIETDIEIKKLPNVKVGIERIRYQSGEQWKGMVT
jgi:hypothetical protein